ncbi:MULTISPECIES: chaperone modulator CbpM [unclassified Pseudofrankia]|uniref:chaperone modulator CbpM n=1 Tax=unclassified Pseudofrankia TaxID=2994372 RepID=UPI0008DAD96F|nr:MULTISPECIES: chaperone modulator CbpM [unclassified Pseudofrankia]MDT3439985.1 chaperone modulator CbpM [Pseudofrankia sp. BMG5.37]OHV48442.1 MerR family transcriptional regulator [Pseudofrankia sp. BMG5.36]
MSIRSPSQRRAVPSAPAGRPRYPLAPIRRLTLETVVHRSGLHPDLLRRFVTLGLLNATRDARGELWFPLDTLATIARIQRLRAGLCLNYAAIGLVLDLLDRIDALEAALRSSTPARPPTAARSTPPWT